VNYLLAAACGFVGGVIGHWTRERVVVLLLRRQLMEAADRYEQPSMTNAVLMVPPEFEERLPEA